MVVVEREDLRPSLLFAERQRRDLWDRALTRKPDESDYPNSFYRAEFERVVLPQGCESADDYMRASRVGRGLQLSRPQRKLLWPIFAEYRTQLRAANLREPEEAYRDALALLKKEGTNLGVRSIVIDETQDLSASALALLRAAVPDDSMIESREAERKSIAETLTRLEAEGIPEKSICIVVSTNEEAIEYTDWLDEIGRKALRLDR